MFLLSKWSDKYEYFLILPYMIYLIPIIKYYTLTLFFILKKVWFFVFMGYFKF